ncbi:putative tetratricopeptide-like helical domain superfamily [Helianthus annuus]|uniref:Tetratricopeptide-like helical domain superfamily, acetyltransferase A, auxiliary subunit n=1 Tax=Helianthus annuus TaxID=4232 RepID=A0A9K3IYD9_HELAN|nr:putative tetratricopeptide-like helical domain superfamily, acetyltransferase A, auxiliary subunit [Helianthus annuus]KAJ0569556.1 putative tetratricopeptide-like helical domain superfamily, protein PHOX1-4 [Helianthus annuus]KAJ0583867.1 putative tetratricopeptide-like helical domain superfamily, protein PHOX1-4 [Helianthus annuus]KAJ0918115.1 putative tetratricopeptide-like helical domain superfamily [Helianthus annuus]KAJ0921882.1 putative 43kDa postsynaptic protein [Helianthus annuus]
MRMGITEFPRAIHESNLALEVTPKYSKALLRRARCYEALNRVDLALKDVTVALDMEPKNVLAIESANRLKPLMGEELTNEKSNTQTFNEETREEHSEKRERVDEKEDFGESIEKIS